MAKKDQHLSSDIHKRISPIHPFPARMAPSVVFDIIGSYEKRLNILDPMSGSGTVLVAAKALGHDAIGMDTDPLSVLISKVWNYQIDSQRIRLVAEKVLERANKRYTSSQDRDIFPSWMDNETIEFAQYWFDDENIRQLSALSKSIRLLKDESTRNLLWCALSRLIITKTKGVSLAMDISHSRPHRVYEVGPKQAFFSFLDSVNAVIRRLPFSYSDSMTSKLEVFQADGRNMPIEGKSIDIIITSPPYLNAIDYLRGHKLSLIWMGYIINELRSIRSENIGVERGLDDSSNDNWVKITAESLGDIKSLPIRYQKMLFRYIIDLDKLLIEFHRVLKRKGKAVMIIGNSSIKGTFIQNSHAIKLLAKRNGFRIESEATRIIPDNRRYLPPPGNKKAGVSFSNRMRQEVVLAMSK